MLAIYTRLSREDEASNSINNQLREGEAFAKDNGFKQFKIYNEGEGISGSAKLVDRPELLRLYDDIKKKEVTAVWSRSQERIARNQETWFTFTTQCRDKNCKLFFANNEYDLFNPNDNFMYTILSATNSFTNEVQSYKTKKALKDNAKEGKSRGIYPYGYKSNNGYFAINETEAKVVESIYNWSLSGIGIDKIAKNLNEQKVPTRRNKEWAGKTIQGIIKNPIYKGEIHHLKSRKDENLQNREIEVFNTAPIIIDSILWQKVNDNLENNRNNSGKKVDHKYLLKGLLKCGKCGRNYYGRRRVDKSDNYYGCSSFRRSELKCGNRGINIDVLEHFVWQRFFADKRILELTKDFLKKDEIEAKLSDLRTENDNFNKDLESLEKERKRALKFLAKGTINEEEFNELKRDYEINKKDVERRIKNNSEQIAFYESSELTTESVNSDLKRLESASFNDKRDLIKKYIQSIEILYKEPYYILRIEFKLSDYFATRKAIKSDYFGDTISRIEPQTNAPTELIENYLIDRNYNIAIDLCYNFVLPLSKKIKSLSKIELNEYAERMENDFGERYEPEIDIAENRFYFN